MDTAPHTPDPQFSGWHLLGTFPPGDPDGVASWLLHHDGEAMLLEVPPKLTAEHVLEGLMATGTRLTTVMASHLHGDHFDVAAWDELLCVFPHAEFRRPGRRRFDLNADDLLRLAGEPVWLVHAPKHSPRDVVTIFRGVAMTGDIELGQLSSVNGSVSLAVRRASMEWLAGFEGRHAYEVHSSVSAHLNDVRRDVDWPALFAFGPR